MEYLGILMLPVMILLFVLAVLAIFMPNYVYRMNHHLGEINDKMSTLIKLGRQSPPVIK